MLVVASCWGAPRAHYVESREKDDNYIFDVARSNCIVREQGTNHHEMQGKARIIVRIDAICPSQQSNILYAVDCKNDGNKRIFCIVFQEARTTIIFSDALQEATMTMVDCNKGAQDCAKQQPTKCLCCIVGVSNNKHELAKQQHC
jgi:hypothetical protein